MPRNIIFIAPFPTDVTMRFVRAAAKVDDVRLLGIVHTPPAGEEHLYADIVRVTQPTNLADLIEGIEVLRRRHGEPYRVIGILEAMMVVLAQAREHFGIAGTSVKTATLFREKAEMKDALRAAGLPVARHRLVTSAEEARAFADEVGYPLVVKPPAGMGAIATSRVRSPNELRAALVNAAPTAPVLVEEMLQGTEHSFETITVGGEPRVWSFANYHPGCLEVLENPWIQWACILPREIDTTAYAKAREVGFAAIRALGLEDGMTHMEWFERSDGSLAIGEIAARPPGPQLLQMTGLVHDIDIYRAWARAVIDGVLDVPWERTFAAGCAYVRGTGRGRVAGIRGVREVSEALGPWLVEARLPTIGASKNPSYEGDGYVVVRHESTEKVKEMIRTVVETLKIHYEA
ncbi:MAG: Carbamoylphosphate synthase large subunit protein [Myxococcales bacterium]|nr:Carbamoylphosphate synthase large subunit protein [Myxococcales bacterium]